MTKGTSSHILNTSANLLGFCLIVMTSLRVANKIESQHLDGFTSIIAVFLTISCIFSFISIRTENPKKERLFEFIADYAFFTSLLGILFIIILITMNYFG